jgi:hypothetical protein
MRYSSILFVLLLVPAIASADAAYAIRPIDHSAAATLARAAKKSAHVRALIRELAATDVIVHFEMSRLLPTGLGGTTRFVAARGGYRFLRLSISSVLPADQRVAMLGHELQHALEIARSGARHVAELRRFFDQHGYSIGDGYFETAAALDVERR